MDRRTVLAAVGTLGFAGCVAPGSDRERSGSGPDGESGPGSGSDGNGGRSVRDCFDGEPTRPECEVESDVVEFEIDGETREYETAATIPYPDAPTDVPVERRGAYVGEFERAYVHHEALCDQHGSTTVLRVSYAVRRRERLAHDVAPTIVALLRAGTASKGITEGRLWVVDLAYEGIAYAVDETGVARAEFDGPVRPDGDGFRTQAPDPLTDGQLVAAIE